MTDRTESATGRSKSLGCKTTDKTLQIPGRSSFATTLALVVSILVVLLSSSFTAVNAQQPQAEEHALKAGHLRYLAHNLAIPAHAFAKPSSPLVIGVIGDKRIVKTLETICAAQAVNGHPIKILSLRRGANIHGCHIVFFSRGEAKRAASVIAAAAGRPVFLVGEFANFCAFGGHLNYLIARGVIKVEFNKKAAEKSGVRVPAKIQRVGKSISTRP